MIVHRSVFCSCICISTFYKNALLSTLAMLSHLIQENSRQRWTCFYLFRFLNFFTVRKWSHSRTSVTYDERKSFLPDRTSGQALHKMMFGQDWTLHVWDLRRTWPCTAFRIVIPLINCLSLVILGRHSLTSSVCTKPTVSIREISLMDVRPIYHSSRLSSERQRGDRLSKSPESAVIARFRGNVGYLGPPHPLVLVFPRIYEQIG